VEEKQISKNIKEFHANKKMFIERLAKLSGLTKGYVSETECMELEFPIRKRA
jgi:hypothetical protein